MIWLQRAGWLAVGVATLIVAIGCFFFRLPEPTGALTIDHGLLYLNGDQGREVKLPLHGLDEANSSQRQQFIAGFSLPDLPEEDLFLLMQTPNRDLLLNVNGHPLYDSASYAAWTGPTIGSPILVRLPRSTLSRSKNELSLTLGGGEFTTSIYLPKIFLGSEAALAPAYRSALWVNERLKAMSLAAQLMFALGIIFAYCYRPKDDLLSWLAGMMSLILVYALQGFLGFSPAFGGLQPFLAALVPAIGLFSIGLACVVSGLRPSQLLAYAALAFPAVCAVLLLTGVIHAVQALLVISGLILFFAVGTGIVAWGAFWRGATEARVMLPSYVVICAFTLRDTLISLGHLDLPLIVLTPYSRWLFLMAVVGILMRRLVMSLGRLDSANADLQRRLAQREAELAALHRTEQLEAAALVRVQERQRLTHDLHDGISGHLVSIIAMTERPGGGSDAVEDAARRALDDLRLVIYSLDLGERDLLLALANLRERLVPQLQRAGVELDWATADLPEVSGVTPSNALSIMRILQEALTNAVKHGPARKITVRGAAAEDSRVAITVENDGQPFSEDGCGFGLTNMRRRAQELGGEIGIRALDHGTRFTLLLPICLPETADTA